MRYEIRSLGSWTGPDTPDRQSSARFRASWQDTLDLLDRETGLLGADLVVVQIDVTEGEIRRDGMLYARAKVDFPGVAVSFMSRHGPLRYATDAYEQQWHHHMPGWQANVRAIALALEALRAVDRYGVTSRGEQYTGWRALPAGDSEEPFTSPEEAWRWIRDQADRHDIDPVGLGRHDLYRRLAARLHPDTGGDRTTWDRLDAAYRILDLQGRVTWRGCT